MTKDQYFEDLKDIVLDSIFVGLSESDLQKEIETNMWRISIQQELASDITPEDFNEFISKVITNRQDQINRSASSRGMIFYLWFDLMASQLRFNLISEANNKLPFSCNIQIVTDPREVINVFLRSPFHNGLPIEGHDDNSKEEEFELKIYKIHLKKQ
ncbi:hypothetical protein [Cohnella sp. WQ 127256]|uniref:hypothetical protein n=1 Tax=Cohnella sp. WQ 127256 TaxID=2938790 RepID=UPI002118E429|nr:hypothetical protein [Cohnella sp. WQ 127256]